MFLREEKDILLQEMKWRCMEDPTLPWSPLGSRLCLRYQDFPRRNTGVLVFASIMLRKIQLVVSERVSGTDVSLIGRDLGKLDNLFIDTVALLCLCHADATLLDMEHYPGHFRQTRVHLIKCEGYPEWTALMRTLGIVSKEPVGTWISFIRETSSLLEVTKSIMPEEYLVWAVSEMTHGALMKTKRRMLGLMERFLSTDVFFSLSLLHMTIACFLAASGRRMIQSKHAVEAIARAEGLLPPSQSLGIESCVRALEE